MTAQRRRSALELLKEEIPYLRRSAIALTRNPEHADDLVQDCLVRAVANIGRWRADTNMRAWLLVILRNVFRNDCRRAGRSPIVDLTSEAEPCTAIPAAQEARMALLEVHQAFLQLPDEQREVLLLVGVEGLTYEEAATALSVPVETMRSRLSRARRRLRQTIAEGHTERSMGRREQTGG